MKKEVVNFANDGFGWYCKICSDRPAAGPEKPRLMSEGEAESKQTRFSTPLVKWADQNRETLVCEICSASESVAD